MVARRALAKALHKPDGRSRNGGRNGYGGRAGNGSLYSEELADQICDRLAQGEPLNVICKEPDMPTESAVRHWVRDDYGAGKGREGFAARYARARDIGYDSIAEGILGLGVSKAECSGPDGYIDNGEVQRLRMLSENRKWLLAKMRPKQFGEKVTQEITGEDGGALITRIELVPVAARPRPQIEHIEGSPVEARNSKRTGKRQKS